MNRRIHLLVAAVAVLAVTACGQPKGPAASGKVSIVATAAATSASTPIGPAGGATFAKYSKIKIGMTYQQVVEVMGNPGSQRVAPSGTMDDRGSTPTSPRGVTVYVWVSTQQGNSNVMHVTFFRNKVTAKDQAGLP